MIKIVADNKIPFLKGTLERVADIRYMRGRDICREDIIDADALIIRTRTKCNESLLKGTKVKYIATATIGFDHIDTQYCKARGIGWTNAPGCNSGSVMQYIASAFALIASVTGKSFGDMSVGIIGVGNVGKKVERLARVLGMRVVLNDPPRKKNEGSTVFEDMEKVLECDIVTMHVPLNLEGPYKSFHLADKNFFAGMKKQAWFINTSRGEVVDTGALIDALRNKLIFGTILDVWENEPDIDRQLLSLSDIATPHIAGYSLDGKANGTAHSVNSLSTYFSLGIDNWYPDDIPEPSCGQIRISSEIRNMEQLAAKLFFQSYNIGADNSMLKPAPEKFEYFRDNYPPRREFNAYRLVFEDPGHPYTDAFLKLGFRI